MEHRNFNRREIEERLPDYIFERLDSAEKELFEISLQNFPDLIQEVENVQNVFSRLQSMDIDRLLDKKTKNIPVKVSQRLRERTNPLNFFAKPAFVSIVAGLGVVLLIVSLLFKRNNYNQTVKNETITGNIVTDKLSPIYPQLDSLDILVRQSNDRVMDFPELFADYFYYNSYNNDLDYLEDIVNESLVDYVSIDDKSMTLPFDNSFYRNFEKLDENDFQQIIKELENVEL